MTLSIASRGDRLRTARGFQGGDLNGIVDRLDYLERLGVDVIYLNPVFLSPSTHRYDTVDYHQVDPHLGGDEALRELVEASHRRGMKVILDASFNHCHPRFFAFEDLLEKGQQSEYRNWFKINEWPIRIKVRSPLRAWQREWLPVWAGQAGLELDYVDDEGPAVEPTYDTWYGVATMPRVNLANPEARAYMLEVAEKWLLDPGIDGWRMDVARYVDHDFWPEFRQVARKARSDAYLIGEFLGDASIWLQGDQFDATMNYSFRDLCIAFLATEQIDGTEASARFARLWAQYPWTVSLANQNLIGSHDTARFLTVAGDEAWRLRLAALLQLTFPGAPGLYYGDEIEMSGATDPGSRRSIRLGPGPSRASDLQVRSQPDRASKEGPRSGHGRLASAAFERRRSRFQSRQRWHSSRGLLQPGASQDAALIRRAEGSVWFGDDRWGQAPPFRPLGHDRQTGPLCFLRRKGEWPVGPWGAALVRKANRFGEISA